MGAAVLSLCQLNCYFFRAQIFVIAGRAEWDGASASLKACVGGSHQSWTSCEWVDLLRVATGKKKGQKKGRRERGGKAEICEVK